MFDALARAALDLLLPAACAGCEAPVAAPDQLCADCFGRMSFIGAPLCPHCGLPFATRQGPRSTPVCPACATAPPPWNQARAALLYDAAAKTLILPLKHADRQENAATLALHMHRAGAGLLATADLLVPVPLHRARLLRRRYNQAALLADALSRRSGVPVLPDALARTRPTVPLGERTASERLALLHGAIAVRPRRTGRLAGQRVLLVDDVLTSGATARACANALLDAGVANVDVLVASRVAAPPTAHARAASEDDDDDD